MPIPSSISDLDTVAANNSPAGSESPTEGDNYIRALSAIIAQETLLTAKVADLADDTDAAKGDELLGVLSSQAGSVARTQHDKNSDIFSIADTGADAGVAATQTAAIQLAVASGAPFVPPFNYRTDTLPTGSWGLVIPGGATFSGATPIDGPYPAFGGGAFKTISRGNLNGLIGIVHNDLPAATTSFPAGVTGHGRNDNAGNHVWGLYGDSRQYASTGCAVNEIDCFNMTAAPTFALPPNLAIGTVQNHTVGLIVGAGGNFNSSIGLYIAQEGSLPQKFLTGIYVDPSAVVEYGLFIGAAGANGANLPMLVQHKTANVCAQFQGVGAVVAANAWFTYYDGASALRFAIKQDGQLLFGAGISGTTVGAAGGASALPATPLGYLQATVNGVAVKLPYYTA